MQRKYLKYFVYILECRNKSLYTGITTDVKRRFEEHKLGTASHYTNAFGAGRIVYTEKQKDRSSASKREAEIKSWKRKDKLKLIKSKPKFTFSSR